MPELFHHLTQNIATVFRRRNLGWHALAIGLTILLVSSGLDWSYYQATRAPEFFQLARPAIILGSIVPLLGILMLLAIGAVVRSRRLVTTAWALGQAALVGFLISSSCKAFTGRLPPPSFRRMSQSVPPHAGLPDPSHGFQFGLLKGGVFWGWPSSHTTVAFAMTACLVTLYPRNKPVVLAAWAYAFYVGLGVSVSIHWLSEFVAGAIIGRVIGLTVGQSFKTRLGESGQPL